MYDICNILCPWDPIQEPEVHKPERKPRLGKGAKLTKRISSIPLLWSVKTSIPSIVKRLDYGYSRMRGGKFSNFFKRIRHTVGRRKFSLGVG